MNNSLYKMLYKKAWELNIQKPVIPKYITDNIKYQLFEWQTEALLNFLTYQKIKELEENIKSTHLLFNMATGTGKTLLMASLILYYYKQGYKHFIFFVNQNNIVGKTEENLINKLHSKYLFTQNIVIDNQTVSIKKVDNFSDNTEDIEVLFTSIHKLHNAVYLVKEDSVFLDDLQKRDIILLGDEAHHLNAATQKELDLFTELKQGSKQSDIERSWEHTVINLILNKGNKKKDNKNALIEFTATVPQNNKVKTKYNDKIIYKFDLKQFLQKGYTKEINLLTNTSENKFIILQALLFNYYRQKIAIKNQIDNFKPVILFRSKSIESSKQDFNDFNDLIENLSVSDFNFLKNIDEKTIFDITDIYQRGQSLIIDIKRFIKEKNIKTEEIINFLKYNFKQENCIITNSNTNTAKIKEKTNHEQELLLNSLEDKNNHIRAIFTVKRLTEGWDVLNLYDIVRLYKSRDEGKTKNGKRKAGKTTTEEVQLIGRGVRYYPFRYKETIPNKRKFDTNLQHELRVLEEFYFHSYDDAKNRYISELKNELKREGYITDNKKIKKFDLKQEFKDSNFFKNINIYVNKKLPNPNRRKTELSDFKDNFNYKYELPTILIKESHLDLEKNTIDKTRYQSKEKTKRTLQIKFSNFDIHIIRKAINLKAQKNNSIFQYKKLKEEFKIISVDDLIKDDFFGNIEMQIIVENNMKFLSDIDNKKQLNILLDFFSKTEKELKNIFNPYIGSEFYSRKFKEIFGKQKEKSIEIDEKNIILEEELIKQSWYVLDSFHGTSEEQNLIEFLKDTMGNLQDKYEEIYLLRNEEIYKIYDFDNGTGFQPDFLLFLKQKEKELYFQIFIEPKGENLMNRDSWKDDFLQKITKRYGNKPILKVQNRNYKLIGLPLFNNNKIIEFETKYYEKLDLK